MKKLVILSATFATLAQTTASESPTKSVTEAKAESKDVSLGILQILKAEGVLTTGSVVADARTGSRTNTRNV